MPTIDSNALYGSNTGVTTFTALAAVAGDTNVVRNIGPSGKAYLCSFVNKHATAGMARVRSPYLHDDVNALRFRTLAAAPDDLMPDENNQPLHGQDTLLVESTGGAAAEAVSALVVCYYDDPAVPPARIITAAEADARITNIVTNEIAVTAGATGTWGSALLSAGTGVLKANQDYAVLGYVLDVAVAAVAIQGPDTANFQVGVPGSTDRFRTRMHFMLMSRRYNLPFVPVINAANAGGTNIKAADVAATAVNIDLILGELH